jgi:hypothetical protein
MNRDTDWHDQRRPPVGAPPSNFSSHFGFKNINNLSGVKDVLQNQ